MPTARELLEQADALMRRNRAAAAAAAEAEAPVAPQPAPAPTLATSALASPRTIQHEPITASAARSALPIEPGEAPIDVASVRHVPPQRSDRVEDVPVLTEAIGDEHDAAGADDVPLLTDAVEEIDFGVVDAASPIVDAEARGEVSMWLDAPEQDASLLGPAPDSVAVVPPPLVPPPGRDPLGLDQPATDTAEAPPPTLDAGDDDVEEADDAGAVSIAGAMSAPTIARAEATGAATSAEDEARIRAIAEEIGMQVLQRIDIFTDTSLRERLGERLRPVVERVSADLVDALNQHVGELLREYVAEAIEREIETWRERKGSE
jgi:hypothetical protein